MRASRPLSSRHSFGPSRPAATGRSGGGVEILDGSLDPAPARQAARPGCCSRDPRTMEPRPAPRAAQWRLRISARRGPPSGSPPWGTRSLDRSARATREAARAALAGLGLGRDSASERRRGGRRRGGRRRGRRRRERRRGSCFRGAAGRRGRRPRATDDASAAAGAAFEAPPPPAAVDSSWLAASARASECGRPALAPASLRRATTPCSAAAASRSLARSSSSLRIR